MTKSNHNTFIDADNGIALRKPEPPLEYCDWPVEQLPEPLSSIVSEGSAALQCDPALIAMPIMSTVGAAIGNARHLQVKEGWQVPPIVWTMVVAESGSCKTPALKLATDPLEKNEHDAYSQFEEEFAEFLKVAEDHEDGLKRWKKKKEGERPASPIAPHPTRFIVKDTTLAALVEIHQKNPRGLLVPTDELASLFGSFDKHHKGGGDAQHWLSIYSAAPISVDRKGARNSQNVLVPVKVDRPFVAITGGVQPGILPSVLTTEHQASGMAARFLMAWPPRRAKKWSDETVCRSTKKQYAELIDSLVSLAHNETDASDYEPKFIDLDAAAKQHYQDWYDRHNLEHTDRSGNLAAASAKIEEIPLRLGLIIHCVRVATKECKIDRLDAQTMSAAITIADWHMREADRIYNIMDSGEVSRHHRELAAWIRRKGGSVTAREVLTGKRNISTAQEAEERLTALVNLGYGTWENVPSSSSGGRPTSKFVLSSVSTTDPKPEKTDGSADANSADIENVKTKRVAL